jgi:uncharacterized protein
MAMFLIRNEPGPNWDRSRGRREQDEWDAHAAFMDDLTAEGFIVLGGPVDEFESVFGVEAADEDAVRARLDEDPWRPMGILALKRIEPWEILLDSRAG